MTMSIASGMDNSNSPEQLRALLDFADESLCLFSLANHKLVLSNAAAEKFVCDSNASDVDSQCTLPTFLGLFLGRLEVKSVMQDIESRRSEKQAYLLDSMSITREGQNVTVSGKLHCYGIHDAILLRVNVRRSKHGGLSQGGCMSQFYPSLSPDSSATAPVRIRRKSQVAKQATTGPAIEVLLADPHIVGLLEASEDLKAWDPFELAKATNHRPLATLTLWCLRKSGLIRRFSLPEDKLIPFLNTVESSYLENPYHNRTHAADVTRSIHLMLISGVRQVLDEEQQLSLYLAAAAHDVNHGGLNNTFLRLTHDPLAITYHDRSPLENMHAATLTRLMLQPSLNFFSHLAPDVFKSVRKYAEDAILHTDPADHVMHMDAWALHIPAWRQHMVMVSTGEGSSDTSQAGSSKRQDATLAVLGMMLKCADVMHMTQPFYKHQQWVELLTEEFFQQGDRELALGMQPMPFMNRSKPQCVPSSQVGFMSFYALPLFAEMAKTFSELVPIQSALKSNYDTWSTMAKSST